MNLRYSLLLALFLSACAGQRGPLVVKQFQLRDQVPFGTEEPMTRMEKERRLHGAVTMAERRNRLGQYYDVFWRDPAGSNPSPVEVVFEYQQGASASLIKRMSRIFPASGSSGTAEFAVIGDDYFKGGKVLAWKTTFLRGNRIVATRRSYLWQ